MHADDDVAKRVFDALGGAIHVHYHYGPARVTAAYRVFPKDGSNTQAFQVRNEMVSRSGVQSTTSSAGLLLGAGEEEWLPWWLRRWCLCRAYVCSSLPSLQRVQHVRSRGRPSCQIMCVQVDPLAPTPTPTQLLEQWQALQAAEKDCLVAVRDAEAESAETVRARVAAEQSIASGGLETPYYDFTRLKV